MMVNVGFNLFLSDCTDSPAEIAACPQMLTPIALLEQGELVLQFARRNAFDILNNLGWTQGRWTGDHEVNMVTAEMTFQDGHLSTRTDLADNFSRSFGGFAAQHLIAVFGYPHKVILNIVDRMRSLAIVGHRFCSAILQGILLELRAEAIRLKAKVLYLAHGK